MNKRALVQSFNDAQAQLVIQTADLPLGTLANMVLEEAIDLQPGFQRRERWNLEKQSALIESFLLNVPVPPIYLAEEADGTYTAIDGKQRLRAIASFMNDEFRLSALDNLSDASGSLFSDLPTEIKNALRLRPFLRVVTLLKQTDQLLKYEVFLRLNRGGESLNAQEIRNVAFRGPLNDKIYELAQHDFLKQQLKIHNEASSSYKEMVDAEYVLRFLVLRDTWEDFSGSLIKEMDRFMRSNQRLRVREINVLALAFKTALERCERLWGEQAFRRPDGEGWRDQTLAGMYDAQMLAVASLSGRAFASASRNTAGVVRATRRLFSDTEFDKSVRSGTNTPARIRYRVQKLRDVLRTA